MGFNLWFEGLNDVLDNDVCYNVTF